ncbi:DUF3291 domain-containing protein [Pseudanabaenaceae cyanobacterium LEGE 13415]|nr:DUF3291 domain-containing protein [Pseudanabaenaceae cyanobacterium LEGE 13415]
MTLISVTRLRVRSIRFLPVFLWYSFKSNQQAKQAQGNLASTVRAAGNNVFWTSTVWENEADMRSFMRSGSHREAMPKLQNWCDEGSVVHWQSESRTLPSWKEAETAMFTQGRFTPLTYPSIAHQNHRFQ